MIGAEPAALCADHEPVMAEVNVIRQGNLIHATYRGAMTMDLVRDAQRQIETLLNTTPDARVLYDTLEMEPPSMQLALEMKAFDARVQPRVVRSATLVPDAMTAFMAKVAFALSRDHKVFYNDREKALEWLGVQPAVTV